MGEGLFFAGQNHVAIKVIASPQEHVVITTKPQDLLSQKDKAARETKLTTTTSLPTPTAEEPLQRVEIVAQPTPTIEPPNNIPPTPDPEITT